MPTVAEIVGCLDQLYPARWAEPWDGVGLVCGDPDASVKLVLFAVDPVAPVAAEPIERGAGLVGTRQSLFLRAVHGVAGVRFPATRVPGSGGRGALGLGMAVAPWRLAAAGAATGVHGDYG